MGLVLKILLMHSCFVYFRCDDKVSVYDNLHSNSSPGINCSETLDKFVTHVDYSVEDFTDYSQDKEEPKYAPDVPKSRQPRNIKRVLSWVGRGFGKVFNSPYIYNFYPIINYSVGKIMQHLPFLNNNPNPTPGQGPPSPDYPQSSPQPNPQQLQQQQQMQQEYEEEAERKQREMQQKQEEAEARAKHAAEEKKLINERAKKLAATYVQLYFAKQAQSSPVTSYPTSYNEMLPQNYVPGEYNVPAQPPVYNPPVYDQAYAQPNYPAAYPPVDNIAPPPPPPPPVPIAPAYNPVPPLVNYVNV
ncbi:hypothetical protein M8J76_007367 [Diaphorina citri]|nr:hypothetical protein M8J76_007367 [Diaphorina citri]